VVRKLLFLLVFLGGLALAGEAVEDYAVQIWLEPDASLTVQEDLLVRVENVAINHGIYRELLTRPPAATGPASRTRIEYRIEETQLDGRPVPWFVRASGEAIRVYIGDSQKTVPPGLHKFTLRYRVRHAVVKSGDRARLDWNLTGNSWRFPIRAVRLHLYLPPQLNAADVRGRVFYGPLGATASLPLVATGERTLAFSYSRELPPGSGLTLQLEWPATLLTPPRAPLDPTLKVLLLAFLAAVFINVAAWRRAGRDPYTGPVIPRFEPPENASAPLAAYLMSGGYNTRAFSAAVAELSQRGLLSVSGGSRPALRKTPALPDETVPRELRDFYGVLFDNGRTEIVLDQANAEAVRAAQSALRGSLEVRAGPLFRGNGGLVLAGQAVAAAALAWLAYRGEGDFGLAVSTVLAYAFYVAWGAGALRQAALAWERYRLIPGLSPLKELFRAVLAVLGVLLPPLLTALMVSAFQGVAVGALVGALLLLGALSAYLIPAYTREGARLRGHLLGLARYLGTTDEAALRRIGAPEDIPARLNDLFPYAVALGLEVPFGRRLEQFARLHPEEARKVVVWNRPLSSEAAMGGSGGDLGRYSASIASALRAAAARAQTSAGGGGFSGGGFSGGGGGGGGGGGW